VCGSTPWIPHLAIKLCAQPTFSAPTSVQQNSQFFFPSWIFALRRPRPKRGGRKQHVCGDKGYDFADARALVRRWSYTLHIKSRGDEAKALRSNPRFRARH
jgi:hypothetical protein